LGQELAVLIAHWHSARLEGVEAEGGQEDMQTYDYIVVGAGSAGSAVANRLSADPRNKVLLLAIGLGASRSGEGPGKRLRSS
jgi:hypothetical protein